MEADHAHLTPAAERLRQAAARYRSDAGDQPRADFLDALACLSQTLLPHLRGEEDEAMPLVAGVLTEAEWRRWDQAHNIKGKSLGRLAADGHWLMDGLDPGHRCQARRPRRRLAVSGVVGAVMGSRSWCCDGRAPGTPGVRCRCAGGRRPARRKARRVR